MLTARWFNGIVVCVVVASLLAPVAVAQDPRVWDAPGLAPVPARPPAGPVAASDVGAQVTLGPSGLSYRYVKTFGVTEEAYQTDAQHLNRPEGLFIDGSDNLYVVENWGARLLRYNSSLNNTLIVGTPGLHILDENYNTFTRPKDVAVDSGGRIWVADEHRVTQFDASGNRLQTFPTWANDPWSAAADNGHFREPWGLAFDHAGRLYVADTGNNRIQVFILPSGSPVYSMTIGTTGQAGTDNLHFNSPTKVTVDSADRLYVADHGNNRVQRCTITGSSWTCSTFYGSYGELNGPTGVHVDGSDHVFIADSYNWRVVKCDTSGSCASFAYLQDPADVATDSGGNVYASDRYNARVQKFDSSGNSVGQLGVTDVPYVADSTRLNQPWGVAVDGSGNVYASEMLGFRAVKMNSAGTVQWAAGTAGLDTDVGGRFGTCWNCWGGSQGQVALNNAGQLLASDTYNNQVALFNTIDGSLFAQFGSGGTGAGQFNNQRGVAVSPVNGDIYVADRKNHRVQIFGSNRVYKAQLGVTGVSGTDNAHFLRPSGVAVDNLGNIYVADSENHRIQVYNSSRVFQRRIGVTGQSGWDFDHLNGPMGVTVDAARNLYIADTWNNRVQVFDSAGRYLTTIGGSWGSSKGSFRTPESVAVDSTGNVYVADQDNNRIQKFAPGVDGWTQVNLNGFGDPNIGWASALAPFNGKLYAGAVRSGGGKVWRWDSAGWVAASTAGFGNPQNTQIFHLTPFKNYLYAGTYAQSGGAELYRSGNGSSWTKVMDKGFGTPQDRQEIHHLTVFSDTLYASVDTWSTGTMAPQIWRSSDGLSWSNVMTGGFGNPNNTAASLFSAGGLLYAGVVNRTTGSQLWRSPSGDSGSWTPVNADGFGNAHNTHVRCLTSFGGRLYAGTDNGTTGGELWRSPDGVSWSRVPVDGAFGGANAYSVESLVPHGSALYAVTINSVDGMGVFRSADGEHWAQINPDGFGDANNVAAGNGNNAVAALNGVLYVSAYNWANGGEIWQLNPVALSGLAATNDGPTPLGQVTTLTATISAGNGDNYAWTPNPGVTRTGAVVSYTYPAIGAYQATVVATNSVSSLTASTTVTVVGESGLTPGQDYTLTYTTTRGVSVTLEIPSGVITEPTTLVYTPQGTPTGAPTGFGFAGQAFDLDAYQGGVKQADFAFSAPVTVEIHYTSADVARTEAISLTLNYWNGGAWVDAANTCTPPSEYDRHPEANWLAVGICHLSRYALLGPTKPIQPQAYLPIVVKNQP